MQDIDTTRLAEQIKEYVTTERFNHNDRLPPERVLAQHFGVTRAELRKGLAELEKDRLIWRHVGRGTFIGARPVLNLADAAYLGELASPAQVIAARLVIEPELARLASAYGSKSDFDEILSCSQRCKSASDWRSYEAWDNNLHYAIAKSTHNKLLVYLFDILNVVRRSTVWGQPRTTRKPPPDHRSFAEHDVICAAIVGRDGPLAAQHMRDHLASVRDRVLSAMSG